MSSAGCEIDDEAAGFVFGAVVARTAGSCCGRGVTRRFTLVFEVRR